jgi:hypothetical protein
MKKVFSLFVTIVAIGFSGCDNPADGGMNGKEPVKVIAEELRGTWTSAGGVYVISFSANSMTFTKNSGTPYMASGFHTDDNGIIWRNDTDVVGEYHIRQLTTTEIASLSFNYDEDWTGKTVVAITFDSEYRYLLSAWNGENILYNASISTLEPEPEPEIKKIWRAVKIAEIEEPLIDDRYNWFRYFNLPGAQNAIYDYSTDIASQSNFENEYIRRSAANYWLTKNRVTLENMYGNDVQISSEQPSDWVIPSSYSPDEYFSVVKMNHQWKVGVLMYSFIPNRGEGTGYMQWQYDSANNPFFSSDAVAADGMSHIS